MTVDGLYRQGAGLLERSGTADSGFDARCLLEYLMDINTSGFFLKRADTVSDELSRNYLELIERRLSGEPLQYILGKWEFMGYDFYVGRGVLIPRPETELLVETAEGFLKGKKKAVVFDLCSGSGCIAVSVARLFPEAEVYAVEKSREAFAFLKRNVELNGVENVRCIKADITDGSVLANVRPDLILSNPPYIKTDEIPGLQQEVLSEPLSALDGGGDGLYFYRVLAEKWLGRINKGGTIAVECGEGQAEEISGLFANKFFTSETILDFNGIQRIVTAKENV